MACIGKSSGVESDPFPEVIEQVDDTPLEEDDLSFVLDALNEVVSQWKLIGVHFGLKLSKLNEIEEANRGDLKKCFLDMVTNWLCRNYNVKKFGEPSWRKVVEVMANPAAGENTVLATAIATKHPCTEVSAGNRSFTVVESLTSELNSQLQYLMNVPSSGESREESKMVLVRGVIEDFINKCTQSTITREEIEKGLTLVYGSELLLSKDVYEWALETVAALPEICVKSSPGSPEEDSEVEKPLFCEDTVYHASLCCVAVSTRDTTNYKDFFNRDFPNHQFEEASMSVSRDKPNVDRYLIARIGKTYFIAFKSEPSFSQWPQLFVSIEHGINVQTGRIPLRFLIKQLHDGYRIVCTGFSFGGTLALSVTASLWNSPLISTSVLEKNLCCITLSPLLIILPTLQEVMIESPQINSTLHSIITQDDFMPRLTMFLDPKNKDVFKFKDIDDKPFVSIKAFQDDFSSKLMHHIGMVQNSAEVKDKYSTAVDSLTTMKLLLQQAWPHLLAKRIKADDDIVPSGCVHLISISPGEGLVWNTPTKSKVNEEVVFIKSEDIEELNFHSLFTNDAACYHGKIVKSLVKDFLPRPGTSLSEVKTLKPVIESVSFHRYGKEFAITITGDNLWFCNYVKVGALKQIINAGDTTQKSLQFNLNIEVNKHFPGTDDYTSVKAWSHFASPVTNHRANIKHKVYSFTFRQEQLAKLTPSELIETAYLCALLEQQPYASSTHSTAKGFSHRFESLRSFLTEVVDVVPIESLVHAISEAKDFQIAVQCCRQLMASNVTFTPSVTMHQGMKYALEPFIFDALEHAGMPLQRDLFTKAKTAKEADILYRQQVLSRYNHKVSRRDMLKQWNNNKPPPSGNKLTDGIYAGLWRIDSWLTVDFITDEGFRYHLLNSSTHTSEMNFLHGKVQQFIPYIYSKAICDVDLKEAYPVSIGGASKSCPLNSPLQILKDGRKEMHWLVTACLEMVNRSPEPMESLKLSQLYNSKMLKKVNEIRKSSLAVCTLLLGAFMEEQIRVPLMKTSFDTARAIELATSAVAVGVWALFSLTFGDVKTMISAIPSRSHILVEVKEYIKGIFKQDTATADEKYAGKLQFMIQGMSETVSCNSHYVSYSLECQLLELCTELNIDESTPLETLVGDWDQIFKDNVMSLVVPSHRSLIARWLKWALMVHHLREELARYTAVGVVGLVNSGKSLLVSTLFDIKIPVGTTAVKRTTVPFLYSMDGVVDGLDVIDFPGVDDRDETISDLAELLLVIAQVVVFVVDYRKAHTESAKKWLEILEDKSVPVLVCLTYADKLYAECMGKDGSHPKPQDIKHKIAEETDMMLEQLGRVPSRSVQFFSFSQDRDSILNTPYGRSKLRGAGIGTPQDVGDWLAKIFESQLDQDELAKKLHDLVHRK